jgi:arylsulfatase
VRKFELKAGDQLPRGSAPTIAGRAFSVSAIFEAAGSNGVIVAQGGSSHGYSLYVQDGRLVFAIRRGGQLTAITTKEPVAGRHEAVARLLDGGRLTLEIDGRPQGTAEAGGWLQMPVDGLEVGADHGGAVGSYAAPNEFRGRIESVFVE